MRQFVKVMAVVIGCVIATPALACLTPVNVNGLVELKNDCRYWVRARIKDRFGSTRRIYTFEDGKSRTGALYIHGNYVIEQELGYIEPTNSSAARYIHVSRRFIRGSGYLWELENRSPYYVDVKIAFPGAVNGRGATVHVMAGPRAAPLRIMSDSTPLAHRIVFASADPL